MGRVSGKIALVTGAGSGIGRSCALGLAREGAHVLATDIDAEGLAETHAQAEGLEGQVATAVQDVTDEALWAKVFGQAESQFGPVSILVNNAGIGDGGPIVDFDLARWQRLMSINLDSVFMGTREAMRRMKDTGGGSIVNISSVAGLRGAPGASAYCASKGGVRLFSKAAALECASMGYGIRVNSVHPGIIDTPIWTKSITEMADATKDDEAAQALFKETGANAMDPELIAKSTTPMGRAGTPEEVADLVVFLSSEDSRYISGQEHVIDGGMTAR
ncbi:MAG: glucose 1-dehydrogenase [Pseudomonadota bacterium]